MTTASPSSGGFQLSEIRKTLVTGLGVIVAVGTYVLHTAVGFLPVGWASGISIGVGILTIVLNYFAPNETDSAERAINRSVRLRAKPRRRGRAAKTTPASRGDRAA